jgi:phage terminase small subunit
MTRGRKPKPTAIKIHEGNPGKRPLNNLDNQLTDPSNDAPPRWLSDPQVSVDLESIPMSQLATSVWDSLYPEMKSLSIIKERDKDHFARYCYYLALWLKLKSFVDTHGTIMVTHEVKPVWDLGENAFVRKKVIKNIKPFPQFAQLDSVDRKLARFEADYGLGPANRARIKGGLEETVKASLSSGKLTALPVANPFEYEEEKEEDKGSFDA